MTSNTQESLVAAQFGPQAAAYVASAVHAEGEELKQLAASMAGRRDARALDLGCGGGHVSFHLAPEVGEVIAYDLSPEMLAAVAATARQRGLANVTTRQGVVETLPFATAEFDLVASRFSAHHWQDWAAGLREARRVLKPDGRAVFIDTVTPGAGVLDTYFQAIELLRDPSHVRNRSVAEWQDALSAAGFVPGAVMHRRLRLDFAAWIARMRTPELHVQAIRSLQKRMSQAVLDYFSTEPDGSYTIDVMTMEALPAR
jgi:SAM-dependent methyltransferase